MTLILLLNSVDANGEVHVIRIDGGREYIRVYHEAAHSQWFWRFAELLEPFEVSSVLDIRGTDDVILYRVRRTWDRNLTRIPF